MSPLHPGAHLIKPSHLENELYLILFLTPFFFLFFFLTFDIIISGIIETNTTLHFHQDVFKLENIHLIINMAR